MTARMSFNRVFRILLLALFFSSTVIPLIVTRNLSLSSESHNKQHENAGTSSLEHRHGDARGEPPRSRPQSSAKAEATQEWVGQLPLPRKCEAGACAPRKYYATTNQQPPMFYLEPNVDSSGRNGIFSNVPSRPWDEGSIAPLDFEAASTVESIRQNLGDRYQQLVESDLRWDSLLPAFAPPQFPQFDRSIHRRLASASLVGIPPECCPTNINHQHRTANFSDHNVLSPEQLADCRCRAGRNYPPLAGQAHYGVNTSLTGGGPVATFVTAFYQMSSKHPVQMYEKNAGKLLEMADPMIIFCEPGSTWCSYFETNRKHAPTLVVPLPAEDLLLRRRFPQDTFWKHQHQIDPEGTTHHKNVNTMLYIIWDEKLILLHTSAMLNPFHTHFFIWVDTGFWRTPAPHAYRTSLVQINMTHMGVHDQSTLLFQMRPYQFNRQIAIDGNEVLVGGNCFGGTYAGISNLYSAFYDTFWTMAATDKFVGSDQKVLYRACHTYPQACHVHSPKKMRFWMGMLAELLPGIKSEKIGRPLELQLIPPEEIVPVPPNGVVDNATSEVIWGMSLK